MQQHCNQDAKQLINFHNKYVLYLKTVWFPHPFRQICKTFMLAAIIIHPRLLWKASVRCTHPMRVPWPEFCYKLIQQKRFPQNALHITGSSFEFCCFQKMDEWKHIHWKYHHHKFLPFKKTTIIMSREERRDGHCVHRHVLGTTGTQEN